MSAADATALLELPTWAGVVLVAFMLAVSVLAFLRRGIDGGRDTLLPIGLVLAAAVAGWIMIDRPAGNDSAGQRRALDMRVLELTTQAMMPGSALACLDAIAGEAVETSCEKALFASPEATAAAVSYVAAQLSLLAASGDHSRRSNPGSEPPVASMRRALEADRFGIVAHVLAVRDGCTADRCETLKLLRNSSRVSANLSMATYDDHVKRHIEAWSSEHVQPVASAAAPVAAEPASSAPVAVVKPPSNLFFPSAASIPPVNIMTAEPSEPARPADAKASAEVKPERAAKPRQTRSPAAQATTNPGVPLQLGPGDQ